MADVFTNQAVIQIIEFSWDCFFEIGASRSMLDFEIYIDIGDAKAVFCHQPTYGVHEAKIMSRHISQLENNNWIRDCARPWDMVLLS